MPACSQKYLISRLKRLVGSLLGASFPRHRGHTVIQVDLDQVPVWENVTLHESVSMRHIRINFICSFWSFLFFALTPLKSVSNWLNIQECIKSYNIWAEFYC